VFKRGYPASFLFPRCENIIFNDELAHRHELRHDNSQKFGQRGKKQHTRRRLMREVTRRNFMKSTAMGLSAAGILAAAGAPTASANPLGLPIGSQTWPVRMMIQQDFPGTLKQLSDIGIQTIELCSPFSYKQFAAIGQLKGPELRKVLSDNGLTCISCHFDEKEFQDGGADRLAWANDVGLKQIVFPLLNGPRPPSNDDVKQAADTLNKIAANVKQAGLQQVLHNEGWLSLTTTEGTKVYDGLLQDLDPNLVKFQFQVSEIAHGFDAAEYLTKYPGRYISMHLQGWDATNKKIVPLGSPNDSLDWKKIFTAAKQSGGIKDYYLEMDFDSEKASVPFLKTINV
jgi:sugar phosphate isomerase/epimerase